MADYATLLRKHVTLTCQRHLKVDPLAALES
jgi:hypothetical protein